MKHLSRHIAILIAAALTLAGCSDCDAPDDNTPEMRDATVYFNINVDIKGNGDTRSKTENDGHSSDGSEDGTYEENTIHRALLVLRNSSGKRNLFVAINTLTRNDAGEYILTAKMPMKDAVAFGSQAEGTTYEAYIIANYGNSAYASLIRGDYALEDYKYHVATLDSDLLNADNGLPMANFEPVSLTVSGWNRENFNNYIEENNPFPILGEDGSVTIERSVARIDYRDKDRSAIEETDPEKDPHTYKIGTTGYVVRLIGMCPVNVSKEFFVFRHILNPTAGDAQSSSTEFLGKETPVNFFLDTDDAIKCGNISALPTDHFINQGAYNQDSHTGYERVSEENGVVKYPYKSEYESHRGYTPWCYLTENTITSTEWQLQGFTTAIMFRFQITVVPENAPEDKKVGDTLDYYYFIRHNDNDTPDEMGPMEFGIVRNNIYKLSIESISGFPDPYNPEGPDEPQKAKLEVNVAVNDWNKIYFETDY